MRRSTAGTQRLSYGEKMTKRASTGSSPAPRKKRCTVRRFSSDHAFVELAVAHDALRQRVVGIVLEDDREPAGSRGPRRSSDSELRAVWTST